VQGVQALTSQRLQQLNSIIIDMAQYFNDSEIQMLACKAIQMIAQRDPTAGDYLGREGVCEAIIAATRKHHADKVVIKCGWCAVSSLSTCAPADILAVGGDNNKTRFCETGVSTVMVCALKEYSDLEDIESPIVQTAIQLADVESTRDALIQAGLCEAIIRYGASSRQHNLESAQAFCTLIQILAVNSSAAKQKLIDAGIFQSLADILQWRNRWPSLIIDICRALYKFVNGNNDYAVKMINAGFYSKLVPVLDKHINNAELTVAGCQVLQHFPTDWTKLVPYATADLHVTLTNIMKKHSGNTVVLTAALQTVYSVAIDYAASYGLFQGGMIDPVINVLTQNNDKPGLVSIGCLAFSQLVSSSADYDFKAKAHDGLCKLLPKVIRAHIDNSDVVVNACKAMCQLYAVNRAKLGSAGACEVVIKAMRVHINKESVTAAGCSAVGSLARFDDHNSSKLCDAGVYELLATVMQKYSDNVKVLSKACIAVAGLAYNVANTTKLVKANLHISVIEATTVHMKEAHLVSCGLNALIELFKNSTTDISTKLCSAGLFELLATIMQKQSDNAAVVTATFKAVESLARNVSNTTKLVKAGVHTGVIAAITVHMNDMNDSDLVRGGLNVLIKLFKYSTADIATELRNAGLCELLPRVIRACIDDEDVMFTACEAITVIASKDASNQVRLGDAGICEAIAQATERHMLECSMAVCGECGCVVVCSCCCTRCTERLTPT
jgi:hypothetical protein